MNAKQQSDKASLKEQSNNKQSLKKKSKLIKRELYDCIPATLCGIPCLIHITTLERESKTGPIMDMEFEVLDSKGYEATWLTNKATPKQMDYLYMYIIDRIRNRNDSNF